MSEIKLLPCPFCGGEAFIYYSGSQSQFGEVVCTECWCHSDRKKVEEAIEKWNTRKPMQEIIEKLEEECEAYRNSDWLLRDKAIKVGTMNTAMDIVKEVGGMNEM